jgi:hypothetical protein
MTTKSTKVAVDVSQELESVDNGTFTLSNGIILKAKYVSAFIYNEVQKRFKVPKVPTVYIADLGREEENPADEKYLEAMQEYNTNLSSAITDAMFLMGIDVVSIPGNVPALNDSEWTTQLAIIGIEVPDDNYHKKLSYLKYIACANPEDLTLVMEHVGKESGATEEDVQRATDSFRGDA